MPVLTLDGPSGSGKGTVGQLVARKLGWHFLDSGALYRVLAYTAREQGLADDDVDSLVKLAGTLEIRFEPQAGEPPRVIDHDRDIGDALRTEEIGARASLLAPIPAVRVALMQKQRNFRQSPGLVADGRDMGTTVFPDARTKIFLTASTEIRAGRRYKQLKDKGFDVSLARLLEEISERDRRDSERRVSPLRPADDAHVLDTTGLGIKAVVKAVLNHLGEPAARV